ncbi:DUF4112 domain-containing protein [Salinimonas marina]|uniref:DUF4112 domain-containing protein n=1 Tax=Salinimonas marina TaxID=2785918 RepID=A0A7S9DYE0_9ALTE|nr:DUF4112 domain-containing protein [Salinimonas marina]QPG05898.1 DUF4112 domain-containing protein [Salinimonas marina]
MSVDIPKAPKALAQAQKLANLMDTAFRIPVVGYRIGLDGLLGFIPGIGDFISLLLAGRIVRLASKMGVPADMQRKMIRNIILDFILGLIPLAGDIADFFFKANRANVKMMEQWWLAQHDDDIKHATKEKLTQWASEPSA